MNTLKRMIEAKREQMCASAEKYGMASSLTLSYSQELDDLLNQHMRKQVEKRDTAKVV